MNELFELEELDATAPSSVVPSDDTAEIVEMLQAERAEEHAQENDEQQDQTMPDPPSTREIFCALDVLRHALYAANADHSIHQHVAKIDSFIANSAASRSRQTKLDKFFKPL